ncbi:TetR family transcriptional regulator [Parafrankia colletiae]|uniref:TetR family transcriptional regulator n=1 Tax=Parafrankia colletiae TaxID=573497 RepID=A0A1S1Q3E3_9ACTN|nr:TetR/AcrR family transcriptional regulator [Parafrankia colletiae]MCK9904289.1 TetR/AcrR family transcriptional regulator [Frankia sp. Cpl3]OHV28480.1 TetR family transcriptional regulator [Parafrankia colletiae]
MSAMATPDPDGKAATPPRRRYDSPRRREQAAQTRERIIDAGSALVHSFARWDWSDLTFRAVAERAGVGERTVYRHFPNESDLHEAVLRRLEEEAGITYEGLDLDQLPEITTRSFATLSSYAVPRWTPEGPEDGPLILKDQRRRDALVAAVARHTADWPENQREMATGMLDVLWHVPSYERLTTMWNLDGDQATKAITWVIGLLVDAIHEGQRPDSA